MGKPFESFLKPMPSGCIEWTGTTVGKSTHRYGRVKRNGKSLLAHRFAYERANGPVPDGLKVLHSCDNTRCCNPDHLFVGTQLDNMADMRAKGRSHRGNTNPARGEKSGSAKLTNAAVAEIRRARIAGVTTVQLASQYHVSTSVISRAATGKTWSHL